MLPSKIDSEKHGLPGNALSGGQLSIEGEERLMQ